MRIPSFSWLFFILCYLAIYISVVSGQCREDQQSLLLQLKNNHTFPSESSSKLKSWNQSIACCQWRGVTCDEERHVIGLDLSEEYISGGLDNSNSLFGLQHLQHLNLAHNYFNSTIPSSFSKLQNLTYLNLSFTDFVGQVPAEISQLTGLITLDLSATALEISSLKNLVQNFTKIRQLYLDVVNLHGQEWQAALLQIPTLQELRMVHCHLSGPLDSSLSRLDNLSVIILAANKLSSAVPETFANFRNLTTLILEDCELVGMFPQKIFQIPTLSFIDISYNYDLHGSFPEFLLNGSLKTLSVSSTSFSGQLPNSIGNLRHLSSLDLSSSQFIGSLPNSISNLNQLVHLYLSSNNFAGSIPSFDMCTELQCIDLSDNFFTGALANSLSNLRQLVALDSSWNNFIGSIPSFDMCTKLQSIDLSDNFFTGALPNSLSNLTQLVHLDLSSNNFTGSIPSFGMCKNFQSIDLSANFFTGAISSATFGDLVNLVDINLNNNSFTGMIPSSIFILPSMQSIQLSDNEFEGHLDNITNASSTVQRLDLSMNHLEGSIPICLFQLKNLQVLILSSNKFSGTIELNMLNKLVNLTELDISYNNLTIIETSTPLTPFPLLPSLTSVGFASCKLTTFPQFLKNHSLLYHIDLSNNHISGTIPQWIWNDNFYMYINLSHNYLTTWEEPVLSNMSGRFILDLNSNLLQGPVPTLLQSFSYLDFSNNNLSSTIPSNIGKYLFETTFISFARNNLQGHVPESICNAPYLQVLNLSNNSLTGTIPKCLIAMNGTLSILDLGKNKLNGTIDTFPGLCSLKALHLNGNSLQGKLPKYLANCAKLEILDIGDNQIHDQFPCWLKSISTLRVLILRSNKLHGSLKCGGTKVAWPHLQIFDLASNIFGGRIPFSFFETWKAMIANEKDGSTSKTDHLQFEISNTSRSIGYYQDRVTVTMKQQKMELVKILYIFTTIDLSCNKFEGVIPKELGQLNALYTLNLSHNAFSGQIPSYFGNMKELESLDLSCNNLNGKIPTQIAKLSFLSVLNLSYNNLVGRIPIGTQIQSFPADSFKGNDGLCGPPLSHCPGDGVQGPISPTSNSNDDAKKSIDWNFISVELGFAFGIGIVVLPLLFYKSWRMRYWKRVDGILYRTFRHLDFVYERRGGKSYRTLRWNAY